MLQGKTDDSSFENTVDTTYIFDFYCLVAPLMPLSFCIRSGHDTKKYETSSAGLMPSWIWVCAIVPIE